jgi:hypothetical protein
MELIIKIGLVLLGFLIIGFILYFGGRVFGLSFSKSFFEQLRKEKTDDEKKNS